MSQSSPGTTAKDVMDCPLCGSPDRKLVWEVDPFRDLGGKKFWLYRCAECEVGYTSPRPTDAELVELYDDAFYWNPNLRRSLAERLYKVFFGGRRKQIQRYLKPGRLLDVGCGDGRFISYMAQHGWDTLGFDFSPTAQALARERENEKVKIITGDLAKHHLPSHSFDLITLWQVLEHIAEPRPLLRELSRLLRPNGLIVVAVPNIDSIQAKIAGPNWLGLDMPRHLTHYSPNSLRRALTTAGFTVRRVGHYSFQYSPFAMYHSLMDRLFTRRDFISDWAKRRLPTSMSKAERRRNVATMTLMSPAVIPVCILDSLISSSLARGGFIEAYATLAR